MTEQINVRLPQNLLKSAKKYASEFGYATIQELIKETLREKVYEKKLSEKKLAFLIKQVEKAKKEKTYSRKELGF